MYLKKKAIRSIIYNLYREQSTFIRRAAKAPTIQLQQCKAGLLNWMILTLGLDLFLLRVILS
jgi:hypothetical protein